MGAYKMRKKILAGIVILSLVASLMACGESEAQKVEATAASALVEEVRQSLSLNRSQWLRKKSLRKLRKRLKRLRKNRLIMLMLLCI